MAESQATSNQLEVLTEAQMRLKPMAESNPSCWNAFMVYHLRRYSALYNNRLKKKRSPRRSRESAMKNVAWSTYLAAALAEEHITVKEGFWQVEHSLNPHVIEFDTPEHKTMFILKWTKQSS